MWYVEAGRGKKLPLTPEEGADADAQKVAQASHVGSYSIRTEMRRSLYHRTFLAHSTLYRGAERRKSTLPGNLTLHLAPPPLRFSCSETSQSPERPSPRPYRSSDNMLDPPDIVSFPLRIRKDLSAETFQHSIDSSSSSSYVSPQSHPIEETEVDVFYRQSSEAAGESRARKKPIRGRLLSFQDEKRCNPESNNSERCVSEGDNESTMKTAYTSFSEGAEVPRLSKEESTENDATLSHGMSECDGRGEGYEFAMKQFESFDQNISEKDYQDLSDDSASINCNVFRERIFIWKGDNCEGYDSDNQGLCRDERAIAFKFDILSEASDSPKDVPDKFTFNSGLFPGKRKSVREIEDGQDEGFESQYVVAEAEAYHGSQLESPQQSEQDYFASQMEIRRREAFRKERSLDSDETSGFVSKHSSETTDLSSRLSSTQFTTKHLSEPMGFGAGSPASEIPQHLSEPTDFGSKKMLSVEQEQAPTGAISKKREHFRKSKRLRHFNLRRIDDTDNDSSCDSDKPCAATDDAPEPPSTRLKEEVGLPKHLSRDSSVDRYGLYKSRSEKTITSFESDRVGQARLQDFESFCEAVTFSRHSLHPSIVRQKAASADETELSDGDDEKPRSVVRRKSRTKRDISRRLKCLLL